MSDSFNPQELLSKLRAKSTNSTAASVTSSIAPEPQSHRQMERRNSGASEFEQRSINTNRVQATKNIRAPVSLTLTPSQVAYRHMPQLEFQQCFLIISHRHLFYITHTAETRKLERQTGVGEGDKAIARRGCRAGTREPATEAGQRGCRTTVHGFPHQERRHRRETQRSVLLHNFCLFILELPF